MSKDRKMWSAPARRCFRFCVRLFESGQSKGTPTDRMPQKIAGLYRDPERSISGAIDQLAALSPKDRLRVLEYYHEYMQRTVRRMAVENRTSMVDGQLWRDVVAFQEQENFDRALERFFLEQSAQIDLLTGLLKRDPFVDRYNRLLATYAARPNPEKFVVVVALDLDYFKKLNEILGHQQADEVLKAVGAVFRQLRLGDEACRIGGDEYMFILTNIPPAEIERALQRIHALLCTLHLPAEVAAATIQAGLTEISVSFGAVAFRQSEPMPFAAAREEADAASYQMKQRGRNGYVLLLRQGTEQHISIAQRDATAYRELFSGTRLPDPTLADRQREVHDALQRIFEEIELQGGTNQATEAERHADRIGQLLHQARVTAQSGTEVSS